LSQRSSSRTFNAFLRLAALCLLLATGQALALPQTFSAQYEVTHSGLTLGEAQVDYRQIGSDRYRYTSFIRPLGIAAMIMRSDVKETSEGTITKDGFRPTRYEYLRTGRKGRTDIIEFDWEQMKIIDPASGNPWDITMPEDIQDRMASQLQLMFDLAHHEKDLSYPIADDGRIKHYTLRIVGRETIQTPVGRLEALKIIRQSANSRRATTFWCAPALGYLPIRIDHREKSDDFTMNLKSVVGFDRDSK
jgi:hypothetical protein